MLPPEASRKVGQCVYMKCPKGLHMQGPPSFVKNESHRCFSAQIVTPSVTQDQKCWPLGRVGGEIVGVA